MGDGILVEFASGLDAVRCAVDIQRQMMEWNADLPSDKRVEFRIGLNMGDVIIADNGDIFGDVVNVAARLEGIAEPGGICVSGRVKEDVEGKLDVLFEDNGEQRQEYRNRSASLSGADQGRYTNTGAGRSRQAVDCRFAFREPKRRPAAGIFRRWHGGRHHHRAIAPLTRYERQIEESGTNHAHKSAIANDIAGKNGDRFPLSGHDYNLPAALRSPLYG
jgi:hypothetical protein